jgi:crotonobetaine/carnitine-CoA ligase
MGIDKSEWVVGKVLARHAAERGERPFVQFQDRAPVTYGEAHLIANRVGNALLGHGVQPGERVAVMLPNCLEYIWAWFGINRIGAVHVGINTAYKGSFLTHVLANAESRVGVFDRDYLPWLAEIEDTVPDMELVFVPGPALGPGEAPPFKRIKVMAFDALLAGPADEIDIEVSYRDIGVIMFTSGTTGPSKGVLMPHAHLYLFGQGQVEHLRLAEDDVYYICMPLFHGGAMLMQLYGTLVAGARAVVVPMFSASHWLDDIRRHGCTITQLLGVMTDFLLRRPPTPHDKDHQLKRMLAFPVTQEIVDQFRGRFGDITMLEAFGMTEINIVVWYPYDDPPQPGCSGKIWDEYFEVIIADPDTDEELARNDVGEVLVRPKQPYCFMQGYNAMPERTVDTWRNFWFHTGDAARMDERGYIWYVDRIKDTIRRRGENISSYEVEVVLQDHPAVEEAAAVAIRDAVGREDEVLACIVLKPDKPAPTPAEMLDFCVPRMPYFAVPRYIEFMSELPKTPSHKLQKQKLRDRGLSPETWDREAAGYKVARR